MVTPKEVNELSVKDAPEIFYTDEEKGLLYRLKNSLDQYPPSSKVRNRIVSHLLNGNELSQKIKLAIASREYRTQAGALWGYGHFDNKVLKKLIQIMPFNHENNYHNVLLTNKNLTSDIVFNVIQYGKEFTEAELTEFLLAVPESALPFDHFAKILEDKRSMNYPHSISKKTILSIVRKRMNYPDDIPDDWILEIILENPNDTED